ncbi:unnamed protein product, partial [Urochloa humidicola]
SRRRRGDRSGGNTPERPERVGTVGEGKRFDSSSPTDAAAVGPKPSKGRGGPDGDPDGWMLWAGPSSGKGTPRAEVSRR